MYQKKPSNSVDPAHSDFLTNSINWGETKSVSFECVWCVKKKCQRENRCMELWDREDYLWGTKYFQKYSSESGWGEWIKDQLGVKVVYGFIQLDLYGYNLIATSSRL